MNFKEIAADLNIFSQCKKYGLPVWQCPQLLFFIMGIVIISSILGVYAVGNRYISDPQTVLILVLLIASVLLTIAFIITNSFERLSEANRMKSEFVGIVSHQLRSPLTNLRWTMDFLTTEKNNSVSEKQSEYFKILNENINRMLGLVSDLLIVSKIETAELSKNQEEFSLNDLVKNLVPQFASFAEASNVEIIFEPPVNLPKAFADPFQIRQVVENLLDNAIRYIKEKGRVEIKIQPGKEHLYLEITDNGVGVPREDQKFIFQKFFRSRNALKYQAGGSGLGLYICRAIIEKAGGKIGFKSKENQGSTFWFTLPIK